MPAVVRQIAYGLAMATAGFLLVALAYSIWAARFRADALILFGIEKPACMFCPDAWPWWATAYAFDPYEVSIGVGVVMWLIGYAIRRVTRSTSFGRPA